MSGEVPPTENWAGAATFLTAAGALIASLVRRGPKREDVHAVRETAEEAINRVSVVEEAIRGIDRRLVGIEAVQVRMENKLDHIIMEQRG